jgi:peptidoglycan hydrolase CwlO-like protein
MEFDLISKWGGLLALIISIITGIWTLISKSTKPFDDRLDAQDTSIKDHDRRIQAVESEIKHLPSSKDVSELTVLVTKLQGDLGVLDNSIKSLTRTVDRMDRALRENGK